MDTHVLTTENLLIIFDKFISPKETAEEFNAKPKISSSTQRITLSWLLGSCVSDFHTFTELFALAWYLTLASLEDLVETHISHRADSSNIILKRKPHIIL